MRPTLMAGSDYGGEEIKPLPVSRSCFYVVGRDYFKTLNY